MKDRLIQTRVPERLENVLKNEAKKRRLTVSHLIRNVLEDTLELVESVVQGAGDIVDTAGGVADQIRRDAGKVAGSARSVVRPRGPRAKDGRAPGDPGGADGLGDADDTDDLGDADDIEVEREPTDEEYEADARATIQAAERLRRASAGSPPKGPGSPPKGTGTPPRGRGTSPEARGTSPEVLAWNRVVVNLPVTCDRCDAPVARGDEAYLGLTAAAGGPPVWRCAACVAILNSRNR